MEIFISIHDNKFKTSIMNWKKIIIALTFMLSITCFGQPYQSILFSDTTRWSVFECEPDAGGTYIYTAYKDTIINTIEYEILIVEYYMAPGEGGFFGKLFLREDTLLGKIWAMKLEGGIPKEVLYMDLSLNKGDKYFYIYDSILVDSVYIENSRKIVEFDYYDNYCSNYYKLKFIEGIGAINGFNVIQSPHPQAFTLLCKHHNDELIYKTEANISSDCFRKGGAGIDNNRMDNDINVFPNPASGQVTVQWNGWDGGEYSVSVYNISGICVSTNIINNKVFSMDLPNSGVYFLFISSGREQFIRKIIINQ
jgi:hypothetical protein